MILVQNSGCRKNSEISWLVEDPAAFRFLVRPAIQQGLAPNPAIIEVDFPWPLVFFVRPNQLQGREVISIVKSHRIAEVIAVTIFGRFSKDTVIAFQQALVLFTDFTFFPGSDSFS